LLACGAWCPVHGNPVPPAPPPNLVLLPMPPPETATAPIPRHLAIVRWQPPATGTARTVV
jgi:hypothetical protein